MQRMTRRLSAVLVSTFVALGLTAGVAGATSGHPEPKRGDHADVSQVLRQDADTHQYAKSKAKSFQFIPVNVNLPVSGGVHDDPGSPGKDGGHGKPNGQPNGNGSYGKDGYGHPSCDARCGGDPWKDHADGDVTQKNDASAESKAENKSFTEQAAWQKQDVETSPSNGGSTHPPCGCYEPPKPGPSYEQPQPCGCDDHWKPGGGDDVSQRLSQDSDTHQKAESEATSHQFVPVNVNLPISILSSGSNNGDVRQTNDASAESQAKNESFTGQAAYQDQAVTSSGNGGSGGDVAQSGSQDSDTYQKADSKAESYQVVPINVNAPISILSHGSNNGDVHQTNDASADSSARNSSGTVQIAGQSQQVSPTT